MCNNSNTKKVLFFDKNSIDKYTHLQYFLLPKLPKIGVELNRISFPFLSYR